MSDIEIDSPDPNLKSIISHDTLKWIFVGGKGGVGKTTSSSSVSIQLALNNPDKQYLLISTDPAHNLSDAFGEKFNKDARKVTGLQNLSCMEIDPSSTLQDLTSEYDSSNPNDPLKNMMGDITSSIPGIDEALSFMEVIKHIKNQQNKDNNDSIKYDTIIFDTAPTGHTLRFLQLPQTFSKLLAKFDELSSRFGGLLNQFSGNGNQANEVVNKISELKELTKLINEQFTDPEITTFIVVCIAEFLSLYESERLIQELNSYGIDVNSIIANQLLFAQDDDPCKRCQSRSKMQQKYLNEMNELYEDFHLVKVPLVNTEVRGLEKLTKFSKFLLEPYVPGGNVDL